MSDRPNRLIVYTGSLGPEAVTPLRDRTRAYRWQKGQTRRVPEPEASDLLRHQAFFEVVTPAEAEARFGRSAAGLELRPIPGTAEVAAGEHLILDPETLRALRQAPPAEPDPKPKPKKKPPTRRRAEEE